jgi:hypothetical protein
LRRIFQYGPYGGFGYQFKGGKGWRRKKNQRENKFLANLCKISIPKEKGYGNNSIKPLNLLGTPGRIRTSGLRIRIQDRAKIHE